MEFGCPICNGLLTFQKACPKCGLEISDRGLVTDYFGPYSPYEDQDLFQPSLQCRIEDASPCLHLFWCDHCGYEEKIGFRKIKL